MRLVLLPHRPLCPIHPSLAISAGLLPWAPNPTSPVQRMYLASFPLAACYFTMSRLQSFHVCADPWNKRGTQSCLMDVYIILFTCASNCVINDVQNQKCILRITTQLYNLQHCNKTLLTPRATYLNITTTLSCRYIEIYITPRKSSSNLKYLCSNSPTSTVGLSISLKSF